MCHNFHPAIKQKHHAKANIPAAKAPFKRIAQGLEMWTVCTIYKKRWRSDLGFNGSSVAAPGPPALVLGNSKAKATGTFHCKTSHYVAMCRFFSLLCWNLPPPVRPD